MPKKMKHLIASRGKLRGIQLILRSRIPGLSAFFCLLSCSKFVLRSPPTLLQASVDSSKPKATAGFSAVGPQGFRRRRINFILILVFAVTALSWPVHPKNNNLAERQFNTAEGAFFDKFYPAAESLFEKFIKDFPQNQLVSEAKLYLAKCFYFQKKYTQALDELKKLETEKDSRLDYRINYWIAKTLFEKKDFPGCLAYLEKISAKDNLEYYLQSQHLKARAYLEISQKEKAKFIFTEIINQPTATQELIDDSYQNLLKIYKQDNNFTQIINSTQKYLQDNPQTTIKGQIYFYLADSYRQTGKLEKAVKYYNLSLEITKSSNLRDLIYQGLGLTYLDQKRNALAKRTIDRISNNQLRLFTQGLYYFNSNDYIPAREALNTYLRQYPEGEFAPKAYLTKADIFFEMGRINDSASLYQTVLEKFNQPEHTTILNMAHYGLAWCHLKQRKFSKAIEQFEKTLKLTDDPAVKISSRIQIADTYQASGKLQKALDVYNQIIRDYPQSPHSDYIQFQIGMIFLKERMLDKSFLAFDSLAQNFPDSPLIPETKYYIAVSYFAREQYLKTQEVLRDLIETNSNAKIIPEAQYLYGKSFFNQQKYRMALEVFEEIIREGENIPISQLAYIDSGLAYLNLEEFEKAKKIYREFLRNHPGSKHLSTVAFQLGGIYEKENNYREAERHYRLASRGSQDTLLLQKTWLALGHLAWGQRNLEKAKEYFQKGAQQDKTHLGLKNKLYLAKIYQEKKQYGKALEIYQELIDTQENIAAAALINKAFLFKDNQKYQKAIEAFNQALKKGITSPRIKFSLGICLERSSLNQEAIKEYFQLIYSYPEQTEYKVRAYFRIAEIYENLNNKSQAKKAYQKIIDLEVEESRVAQERLRRLN